MSNNFDDLPYISVPPETLEIFKALKNSVPPEFLENSQKMIQSFGPSIKEAQSLLSSPSAKMAQEVANSVPPEVIEGLQAQRVIFEKLYKSLSVSQNLGEKKVKKVEEVAQEIVDEYSEDLNPVIQMTEEGLVVVSEINWNIIENLEPNEEIPTREADKIGKTFLFSVAFKKLKGLTPDKITKSDVYQWFAILYMILSFLYLVLNLADKLS